MFAIMPHSKPVDYWNKDIDEGCVVDIFTSSREQHKKDTKDDFERVNHKTHPTNKQDIIQAYELSFYFINVFISSHTLISQSKYCVPGVLHRKLDSHISYDCVLDHPLCNIPMDIDWLFNF